MEISFMKETFPKIFLFFKIVFLSAVSLYLCVYKCRYVCMQTGTLRMCALFDFALFV